MRATASILALLLVACGGGGGGEDDTSTDAPPDATDTAGDTATDMAEDAATDTGDDADDVLDGDATDADAEPPPLPACGTDSPEALMACVETSRYVADLEFVAHERTPGSDHWQAVQDLCAAELEEAGFTVELDAYATGVNVVGTIPGGATPGEIVMVSAHYDHIAGCDGADDNASGVAGALEAARVLGTAAYSRTLVVACWDEEEDGLIGSADWAARAATRGDDIVGHYDFEMIGYKDSAPDSQLLPAGFELLFPAQVAEMEANEYRGDFITIVPDEHSRDQAAAIAGYAVMVGLKTATLELADYMTTSPLLADLQRSDHAPFWDEGYPAMMITDTANFRNLNYHCVAGPDSVERLDHEFATQVIQATIGSAAVTAGL